MRKPARFVSVVLYAAAMALLLLAILRVTGGLPPHPPAVIELAPRPAARPPLRPVQGHQAHHPSLLALGEPRPQTATGSRG